MTHRCPDEETLAAWFDGLLPPADEAAFLRELRTCPDCLTLVAALGMVVDAEEPDGWQQVSVPAAVTARAQALWPTEPSPIAPSPIAQGLRIAARWIGDALQPLADALAPMPLAAVAVRGAAAAETTREELRYQVTFGDLPLEIDLEVDGPDEVALTVRPIHPPPAGLLLRLSAAGETRALSSLGRDGATVDALPPGQYELVVEQADQPLGRLQLDLEH